MPGGSFQGQTLGGLFHGKGNGHLGLWCVRFMEEKGPSLMEEYMLQLKLFYQQAKSLKHVKIFDKTSVSEDICFDQDISKILISVGNSDMTGQKLYHKLLNT